MTHLMRQITQIYCNFLLFTVMCDKAENSRLPEGTYLKTGVINLTMDIQQPVSKLRTLLEADLGIDLSNCQIWLQDKMKLAPHMSLGEQCIQSEGLAQIKLELNHVSGQNRINIVDVLRVPDDYSNNDVVDEGILFLKKYLTDAL